MSTTKTGLVPNEDTGTIFMSFDAPAGSTLSESESIMQEIQAEIKQMPQIQSFNMVTGFRQRCLARYVHHKTQTLG